MRKYSHDFNFRNGSQDMFFIQFTGAPESISIIHDLSGREMEVFYSAKDALCCVDTEQL
jgi:hypothetical protein